MKKFDAFCDGSLTLRMYHQATIRPIKGGKERTEDAWAAVARSFDGAGRSLRKAVSDFEAEYKSTSAY